MSDIRESVVELIGKTPMLRLHRYESEKKAQAELYAKLEYLNPAGSVKDRVGLAMIEDAEKRGILKAGGTIIEPTSGMTGQSALRRWRQSGIPGHHHAAGDHERRASDAASGLRSETGSDRWAKGMTGAIEKAKELQTQIPGSVILGQFDNPANARAHYETTGPEIFAQMDGDIDIFVAGVGTGGTITGVGRYLKEKKPDVKIVAVEPAASPVLSKGTAGPHKIQGIGAGFVPKILDTGIYDEILPIENEDAFAEGKHFALAEGIMVGISSGAALKAASILAARPENVGKKIVVLLPDSGDRYLSTPLFMDEEDLC